MLKAIADKLDKGRALDRLDALFLMREADLLALGRLADALRRRLHPQGRVTFVVDRNVNYTNICQDGLSLLRLLPGGRRCRRLSAAP